MTFSSLSNLPLKTGKFKSTSSGSWTQNENDENLATALFIFELNYGYAKVNEIIDISIPARLLVIIVQEFHSNASKGFQCSR